MDELIERHKQEKKDLQAKIQSLKHSVPKGDKKRKKELAIEINNLEKELKERHETELKTLKPDSETESAQTDLDLIANLNLNTDGPMFNYKVRSISKANRKREKKALKEKEKAAIIDAETELLSANSSKREEEENFKKIFKINKLSNFEIPSDGDCLYKAIEHQLSLIGVDKKVDELRKLCANMLRKRKGDFSPFMIFNQSDDLLNDDQFEEYCDQVENSKCWGGNIELQALSYALQLPIKVFQANGIFVNINFEQFESAQPLLLSYHRHAYQLGEHYNSVVKTNQD